MEGGFLLALTALVMAVGLAGVVLPLVPGLGLIWLAGLSYGVMAGFGPEGLVAMGLMTALLMAGMLGSVLVPARRGRAEGLSMRGLIAAAALGIVGFFVVPVVGAPLAAAGVLLIKHGETGSWPAARRATWSVMVGFGIAAALQLAAGIAMVVIWAVWAL